MRRTLAVAGVLALSFLALVVVFLFVGSSFPAQDISWGVNFSQKHASNFGMDFKEVYVALLEDLGAKKVKVAAHWDLLHPSPGRLSFEDIDWQMDKAKEHDAKVLLAVGMKTPRWPECHIPEWAQELPRAEQQKAILEMLQAVVLRYKDHPALYAWQVENEPFFPFGECPWASELFLKNEVSLVQSIDDSHPVVISDSGEGSFWMKAARHGDIVGTTLYRKAWFSQGGFYVDYPFPPVFYQRKAQLIDFLFGKEVIGVELQAEPWGPKLLYDVSLQEQEKTMNPEQFKENIEFAKQTGFEEFYLWGGEWWYFMKKRHNDPRIWELAKKLF